jgi:hypothetical protein
MQIVIPYMQTFQSEISLKYALRSAEMYLPNITALFIIGDCPIYLSGFEHIEHPPCRRIYQKEKNIYDKMVCAVQDERVEETFCCMHDDQFLLVPHKIIPDYYSYTFGGGKIYQNTVRNTRAELNFDVHAPKMINKERFIATLGTLDWDIPFGYCIYSSYFKGAPLSGNAMHYEDLKIRKPVNTMWELEGLTRGRWWFSIDDKAINKPMTDFLKQKFPKPSRWEMSK